MGKRLTLILVFMLLAGAAVALFIFTLGMTGQVSVGSGSVRYVTGAGASTSGGCNASYVGDDLNVAWADAMPGSVCEIVVVVGEDGNTVPMRLQAIQTPTGLDGMLEGDCGKTIQVADPNTYGVGISLTLEATEGTVSFGEGDGLEWVPATDYQPSTCS